MQRHAQVYANAVTGNDLPALLAMLCDNVRIEGPDGSARGVAAVCRLFSRRHAVAGDMAVTDVVVARDGVSVRYRCRIGDGEVEGSDLLRFGPGGRITAIAMRMAPLQALALMPVAGSC